MFKQHRPVRISDLISPEHIAQFVFRALERSLSAFWKIFPGAVDVEIQHRHGRLIRLGFAPFAVLSRALQGEGDFSWTPGLKNFRLEIQGVALLGHAR